MPTSEHGPDGVTLRPATAAHVPAVARLVDDAYRHYVPRIGAEPGPMRADHAEVVARGGVLVAESGEDLVGVLVLVTAADHVLIENVAVAPAFQGRGLGGWLLDVAERRAREAGRGETRLYTHEAMTENLAIYTGRGYRETHRDTVHGLHRVHLAKPLGPV